MVMRTHLDLTTLLIAALLCGCATPISRSNSDNVSSPERTIFIQAITAGAIGGGAIGTTAGYLAADKNKQTWALMGGAVGSLLGAVAGHAIAEQQIQNLRNVELDNNRLQALLRTAWLRNQEVAQYNDQLTGEITALKRQNKTLRGQITNAKLKEARQKREYVQRVVAERSELANKLIAPQRAQYIQTLTELQNQERKLDQSIEKLERIEEQARIGA